MRKLSLAPRGLVPALGLALALAALLTASLPAERARAQADELQVDLLIERAEGLAAFDAEIRYDPALLAPSGLAPGAFLPEGSEMLGPETPEKGRVLIGSYSTGEDAASGDGTLAMLRFEVLGEGDPGLELVAAASGAYDKSGASISPPARIFLEGSAPETATIYLPSALK